MNTPGMKFHELKGDLKGFFSVSVSGNWRAIFEFEGNDAHLVGLNLQREYEIWRVQQMKPRSRIRLLKLAA